MRCTSAGALCALQSQADPLDAALKRAEAFQAIEALVSRCRLPSAAPAERDLLTVLVGMTRALLPDRQL
jgi:hypothetical protein